ncbi:acyltransferase family protein [Nocardioides dongxiaopingii]|uniref:acyltransferase family protein n=1 Tax=Nocardioides dongxiaopingii TaxID=2576036 RepID=UPI0010C767CB|nr:acyltransferase family protein [Nocardioides dongxiaopingii]
MSTAATVADPGPGAGAATDAPGGRAQRLDIQGLRALAVGLVLLYHLWPNRLGGGFVGVDVFFVISGFLIGGHLLAELGSTGRIRLGRFWVRRARRLLPASLLVLAAVTVAVLTIVPLSAREDFLHQVAGSALYVQNWVLADQAVDYLAIDAAPAPVQHYWSLAVEEQLYVALPLVLVAGLLLTRGRVGQRARRWWPVALLGVLAVASLAWSVVSTGTDPGVAYFSTLTRAWEFLAGALLAATRVRLGPVPRLVAGTVGLGAILLAAATFDGDGFPGAVALVPVLGAVLVLAAHDRGPVGWASRWRPVSWLGDVSYAVYLWHWPLIVLVPHVTDEPLGTVQKLAVAVVTVVLAWVSTAYVEHPLRAAGGPRGGARAGSRAGRRGTLVLAATLVTTLAVAATAVLGARSAVREQEDQLAEARARLLSGDAGCLGAAAMDPRVTGCEDLGDTLVPPPSSASIDDYVDPDCWAFFGVTELRLCGIGSDDPAAPRVLAVGDSHSYGYLPAYETLAEQLGWHVDVATRAGCSWGTRPQGGRTETYASECNQWKQALADHLAQSPPYDVILTTADQGGYLAEPGDGESAREATVAGHREAWAAEVARGSVVVALRDYPAGDADVVGCVEEHEDDAVDRCSRPRDEAIGAFDALARAVEQTPGSALVDLRDLMCTEDTCLPVVGNVVVYRNKAHLTASFVRTLAPYLVERVPVAVERARRSAPAG